MYSCFCTWKKFCNGNILYEVIHLKVVPRFQHSEFVLALLEPVYTVVVAECEVWQCFSCRFTSISGGHISRLHQDKRIWHWSISGSSVRAQSPVGFSLPVVDSDLTWVCLLLPAIHFRLKKKNTLLGAKWVDSDKPFSSSQVLIHVSSFLFSMPPALISFHPYCLSNVHQPLLFINTKDNCL